jgi:hypothetical protein
MRPWSATQPTWSRAPQEAAGACSSEAKRKAARAVPYGCKYRGAIDRRSAGVARFLRHAVEVKHKAHLVYTDLKEATNERSVRPLGCVYWGTVDAGPLMRIASRIPQLSVRSNRSLEVLGRAVSRPGKTLADLLRVVEAEDSTTLVRIAGEVGGTHMASTSRSARFPAAPFHITSTEPGRWTGPNPASIATVLTVACGELCRPGDDDARLRS